MEVSKSLNNIVSLAIPEEDLVNRQGTGLKVLVLSQSEVKYLIKRLIDTL